MQNNLLLVFIKNPVLGRVKTRLARTIGEERALLIYERLLEHTLSVTQVMDCAKHICYADYIPAEDEWLKSGFRQVLQHGRDLGERMLKAFQDGFEQSYRHVVIIGSDCPTLTTELIKEAFDALHSHPVVIGPAKDGGYYLLGMRALYEPLFRKKSWSTAKVLAETLQSLKQLGVTYYLLPTLSDVDEEADLIWLDLPVNEGNSTI
jgi:hypothetical protein